MTDDDLRSLLRVGEGPRVEFKQAAKREEVKKVAVAFANRLNQPEPGALFVGVRNDGSILGIANPDETQRDIRRYVEECFPRIERWEVRPLAVADVTVVALVVWESNSLPHFTGAAYVRRGSESVEASIELYERLIANHRATARRQALRRELSGFRYRMATLAYSLAIRFGPWDRALLEWLLPIVRDYDGPGRAESLAVGLPKLLALSDGDLAVRASVQRMTSSSSLFIPTAELPYLDGVISDLHLFDGKTQEVLLDIRKNVRILNDSIEQARYYERLTFAGSLIPENHAAAIENSEVGFRGAFQRARVLADRVTTALGMLQAS